MRFSGTSFEKDESQPLDNIYSHRRSQSKPLENFFWTLGKGSPYNRIVHLENFEAEIALVNKETGLKFKFPKGKDSHESPRRKWIADVYVGNVKWNHLKNRIPSNYGQYYSGYTRDLVQRLYINDNLIYNYSFPYSLPRG